jgi:hypothetical protein
MSGRGRELENDLIRMHKEYAKRNIVIERKQPPSVARGGGRLRPFQAGPVDFEGANHALEAKSASDMYWSLLKLAEHQAAYLESHVRQGGWGWIYLRLTSPNRLKDAIDSVVVNGRTIRKAVPPMFHLHDFLIRWEDIRLRYHSSEPGSLSSAWLMQHAAVVLDCDWLEAAGRLDERLRPIVFP